MAAGRFSSFVRSPRGHTAIYLDRFDKVPETRVRDAPSARRFVRILSKKIRRGITYFYGRIDIPEPDDKPTPRGLS